jgi:hypothetical protein
MKRIVRLTESDLTRIVRRVISERNILSEEYVLAPVPGNYSVSWMRGLLGVVMPTSTPDGGYQYGFFNDANKNKRLKVSGYIKKGKYPFKFQGGKAIVQTPEFSFTLSQFGPDAITNNVDQLTPQKAAAKGYKYYFVVDTASDGSAVYKWSSSSGKSWNANSLTNTREISSVAWGASTAP